MCGHSYVLQVLLYCYIDNSAAIKLAKSPQTMATCVHVWHRKSQIPTADVAADYIA